MHNANKIEKQISISMRIGVALAAIFMLFGFVLLLINYQDYFAGYSDPSFVEIFGGLFSLNPYSFMLVGIFLLILTPVLRIVTCIILFARQKDKLYTAITIFVLIILTISFIVGLIIH